MQSPYKLKLVEWVDSRQPTRGWQFIDDIELQHVVCVSVGYEISSNDERIVLAATIGDIETNDAQCMGAITIPVCAIRKMADLSQSATKLDTTSSLYCDQAVE